MRLACRAEVGSRSQHLLVSFGTIYWHRGLSGSWPLKNATSKPTPKRKLVAKIVFAGPRRGHCDCDLGKDPMSPSTVLSRSVLVMGARAISTIQIARCDPHSRIRGCLHAPLFIETMTLVPLAGSKHRPQEGTADFDAHLHVFLESWN